MAPCILELAVREKSHQSAGGAGSVHLIVQPRSSQWSLGGHRFECELILRSVFKMNVNLDLHACWMQRGRLSRPVMKERFCEYLSQWRDGKLACWPSPTWLDLWILQREKQPRTVLSSLFFSRFFSLSTSFIQQLDFAAGFPFLADVCICHTTKSFWNVNHEPCVWPSCTWRVTRKILRSHKTLSKLYFDATGDPSVVKLLRAKG